MAQAEKAKKDYNRLTPDDILDLNQTYGEKFYTSGDALKVIEYDRWSILHDGRKWGWSDTEVRENLGEICTSLGINFENYL